MKKGQTKFRAPSQPRSYAEEGRLRRISPRFEPMRFEPDGLKPGFALNRSAPTRSNSPLWAV